MSHIRTRTCILCGKCSPRLACISVHSGHSPNSQCLYLNDLTISLLISDYIFVKLKLLVACELSNRKWCYGSLFNTLWVSVTFCENFCLIYL